MTKLIKGADLSGPRSYFTNLDHSFSQDRFDLGIPALKLQALLKRNIVVAASSIFDQKWFSLVRHDSGLRTLVQDGVILPAIRDEYQTVGDFFDARPIYSKESSDFYRGAVSSALCWSLRDTTDWFADKLVSCIADPQSVPRAALLLPPESAEILVIRLNEERLATGMLTREAALAIFSAATQNDNAGIRSFIDLLYGISGAKAVNSEGHFPQFRFAFEFPDMDARLDDDTIFWDYFIGGIMDGLNTLCRLDPLRLQSLSFSDIAAIRRGVAFENFSEKFDRLSALAKASVPIDDEDRLILNCQEVLAVANALKLEFFDELGRELASQKRGRVIQGYYESASTVFSIGSLFAGGPIGVGGAGFGVLSSLNSSPIAARIFGPTAAAKMERYVAVVKDRFRRFSGLPSGQQTALIDMYRGLVLHGIE